MVKGGVMDEERNWVRGKGKRREGEKISSTWVYLHGSRFGGNKKNHTQVWFKWFYISLCILLCTCEGVLLSVCMCTFMLWNILRQKKASRSLFSLPTMNELKTEIWFSCLHTLSCPSGRPLFNFHLESHPVMVIWNTMLHKCQPMWLTLNRE